MTHMPWTMTFTSILLGILIFGILVVIVRALLEKSPVQAPSQETPTAPAEVKVVPVVDESESSEDDEARLKRESRAALMLRLARLFSKIDPQMTYEPYRQLDLKRAEEQAIAILAAVNSFLMAGYLIGVLKATSPITEANPLLKNRISGLLYVGLRQQVNHLLSDELEKLIDDPVFVKEAFNLYDEINDIPSHVGTEDYFEIYETHV